MGERGQLRITGHDILKIPNHIVDEFRDKGIRSERTDLRTQEIQLISDVLSMDDTYSCISYAVDVVQSSAIDQMLQLRLDRSDLCQEQLLVLIGHPTF